MPFDAEQVEEMLHMTHFKIDERTRGIRKESKQNGLCNGKKCYAKMHQNLQDLRLLQRKESSIYLSS